MRTVTLPPLVSWADFRAAFAQRWEQGEHVSIVGPTGVGKTTLAIELLPLRRYSAVFGTKPRDASLDRLRRAGWRRVERWEPRPREERVLLWPKLSRTGDWRDARDTFETALQSIYREKAWCVYVDEARVICDERRPFLGLAPYLRLLWTQGRSLGVSIVAGCQRPVWVPPEMFDQATHLFAFRDPDRENLRRLAGLGGIDAAELRALIPQLGPHECLYLDTRRGTVARTECRP